MKLELKADADNVSQLAQLIAMVIVRITGAAVMDIPSPYNGSEIHVGQGRVEWKFTR
jgi:hypothetical protein